MPATVRSAAIVGIDAVPVEVQVEELPVLRDTFHLQGAAVRYGP